MSKGNKQKQKEKTDQVRDTLKDKRRIAFNRKGLAGAVSGTISPLSEMDQNNLSGQHSQEKFIRWASEQPQPGREMPTPHMEGAAVRVPDGNGAALPGGPCGPPCRTPAGQGSSWAAKEAFSLEMPLCSSAG